MSLNQMSAFLMANFITSGSLGEVEIDNQWDFQSRINQRGCTNTLTILARQETSLQKFGMALTSQEHKQGKVCREKPLLCQANRQAKEVSQVFASSSFIAHLKKHFICKSMPAFPNCIIQLKEYIIKSFSCTQMSPFQISVNQQNTSALN